MADRAWRADGGEVDALAEVAAAAEPPARAYGCRIADADGDADDGATIHESLTSMLPCRTTPRNMLLTGCHGDGGRALLKLARWRTAPRCC